MRRLLIVMSAVSAALLAASAAQSQSLDELQERYCTGDAFRLCLSEIPDVDRITACMARQRHLLSPDCRAVFDASASPAPRPVARVKPRRSSQLPPE